MVPRPLIHLPLLLLSVLTDGAARWPALGKWADMQYLLKAFEGRTVIAGSFQLPIQTYLQYACTTWDEMPLYLFDKQVGCAGQATGVGRSDREQARDHSFTPKSLAHGKHNSAGPPIPEPLCLSLSPLSKRTNGDDLRTT